MVLAVPGRVVTVALENLGHGAVALRHQRVVAGETGAYLHDDARGVGVMVTTGDQGRPGGRAEGGGMELVVADPGLCDAFDGRCRYRAPEGAGSAETDVIRHDEQDIGSSFRSAHLRRKIEHGLGFSQAHMAFERLGRDRQHRAIPMHFFLGRGLRRDRRYKEDGQKQNKSCLSHGSWSSRTLGSAPGVGIVEVASVSTSSTECQPRSSRGAALHSFWEK